MSRAHPEHHFTDRIGWLRAAVLGANDGIISTASLLLGVTMANVAFDTALLTGIAALVAGAVSMAAGEYVSVSSQADTENADLARERKELRENPEFEHRELAGIYTERGLDDDLAHEVARQLMQHDALGAHARDELGLTEIASARPLQAALFSAVSFATGAALPIAALALAPYSQAPAAVAGSALCALVLLGWLAAYAGRARVLTSVRRVVVWGALAMAATSVVGSFFGAA